MRSSVSLYEQSGDKTNVNLPVVHKTKMEIISQLAQWLLIILGVAATGLSLSGKHRDAAIWVGFLAGVSGCLWFCAWLQDYLWKQDEADKARADAEAKSASAQTDKNHDAALLSQPVGVLEPANDPVPAIDLGGPPAHLPTSQVTVAEGEMLIFFGNVAISTPESTFVALRLYEQDLLTIARNGDGITVTADVWDEEGNSLASIEANKYRVNPNKTLPILRPDRHTLVVDNERKVRVLSVRFLNPLAIRIAGVFRVSGGKYPVVIDDKRITFGPLVISGGAVLHVQGRTIFDWPGKFGGSKQLIKTEAIPTKQVAGRFVGSKYSYALVLKDTEGDVFSLVQIGGEGPPKKDIGIYGSLVYSFDYAAK